MSSNFNNAKIINVYYTKGDRKPYDVNGKPIAYIGEEYIGANEATELRFHFGEELDSASAIIVAKRANGDTRLDPLELVGTGVNSYFKVRLNAWYAEYKGKMTIIFKVYNGTVTYDDPETPTQIVSTTGQIIVSDIFNLEVAYAPNASSLVPPFETEDYDDWFFTLSTKLDKAQSITVTGALPTLTGGVYDDRYFYVEDEGVGRLYYINGSTAIEVVWQVGTLRLTPTGNGEVTADTGKLSWNQPNGTVNVGLYNNVTLGLGEDIFYYGKASGAIVKGDIVQFAGTEGDHFLVKKAVPAEINANPKLIMGVAKQDMDNNEFGYIAHFGKIEGVDTKGFAVGSFVWFSSSSINNGEWTTTQPTAPNAKILVAVIVKAETSENANNGVLLVRPTIEPSLKELQDVNVVSIANNQILRWNNSTLRWENTSALTTAETNITDLQGRMTTEEANVDNLQSRMTTAESNIINIEDGTTAVGRAIADENGDDIPSTYLKQVNASATYIPLSQKGANNGVVPLNSNGKISSIYLSGEQDDFIEFANLASFPLVGEADIIYCAIDTGLIYRWTGSTYAVISPSLALGTTSTTAYRGDLGQVAYDNANTSVNAINIAGQANTQIPYWNSTNNRFESDPQLTFNAGLNRLVAYQALIQNDFFTETISTANGTPSANIALGTTGTTISRNINDTNAPLKVNKVQGTGNILELRSANANKLEVDVNGWFYQNGTRLFTQPIDKTNTFFGEVSGNPTSTGVGNSGYGRASLTSLTSGANNNGFGLRSLNLLTTGSSNTAVGNESGRTITTGSNNTFLGQDSGFNALQLVSATNSTAIGNGSYTDKSNQMVFGNASVTEILLSRNLSGIKVGVGTTTPALVGFGNELTLSGSGFSGQQVAIFNLQGTTTTDANIGALSFFNSTTRIGNIASARSGADNSGRLIFSTATTATLTEKMTILPNGNVGIGTASPAVRLHIAGGTRITGQLNVMGDAETKRLWIDYDDALDLASIQAIQDGVDYKNITLQAQGGRVGIGTSTNLDEVLTVNGTMASPISLSRNGGTDANNSIRYKLATESWYAGVGTNKDFAFRFNSGDLANSPALAIKTTGRVGINTNAPGSQLQVNSGNTTLIPLIIDTLASHVANLAEFRSNGTTLARVSSNGSLVTNASLFVQGGITTTGGVDVSRILLSDTGTTISRNIADTNPALIVNLANASATGNIQVWQKAGTALGFVDNSGYYGGVGIYHRGGFNNAYIQTLTTGTTIARNINDANVVLKVQQSNVSASGRLQEWIAGSTVLAYTDIAGEFYNFTGTYGTISDLRVKENIIDARDYTEDLMKLRVVKYSLKKDQEQEATKLGFIAQEVEQVFPNMVQTTETDEIKDLKSIKMSVLIPMLVKTIQELTKRVEELEKK